MLQNKNLDLYCQEVAKVALLTREEEQQLATQRDTSENEDERDEAREKLITANLRLVVKIAKNYQNLGLDYLDLINEGNMGLMRAAERFKADSGAKFSTYSSWWIRQGITKALSEDSRLIRLPTYLVQKTRTLASYVENYIEKYGEKPTPEEISKNLGYPLVTVQRILSSKFNLVNLDSKISTNSDSRKYAEVIQDGKNPRPDDNGIFVDDKENLFNFLNELTVKERTVVEGRFGFDGGESKTLESVGNGLGITRERVRQIEMMAMRKLRFRYKRKYGELVR